MENTLVTWDEEGNRGSGAFLAFHLQKAAHLLDTAQHLAEAEAGAFAGRLGREERIASPRQYVLRHSTSVIDHLNLAICFGIQRIGVQRRDGLWRC